MSKLSRRADTLYIQLCHINVQRVLAEMQDNANRMKYWSEKRRECLVALKETYMAMGVRPVVFEQRDLFEDVPYQVLFPDD